MVWSKSGRSDSNNQTRTGRLDKSFDSGSISKSIVWICFESVWEYFAVLWGCEGRTEWKHKRHLYYCKHLICRVLLKTYAFKRLLFFFFGWILELDTELPTVRPHHAVWLSQVRQNPLPVVQLFLLLLQCLSLPDKQNMKVRFQIDLVTKLCRSNAALLLILAHACWQMRPGIATQTDVLQWMYTWGRKAAG